ncbi:hypothetical protein AALP_AA5G156300 [Arabis alpina]|uniref:DUF4283 domain-containing protein n=1 Tax=Arabis alpina TaxID=50452 RepID=A0A087GXB6_ARAAL|nr:hypothetical protein AALP_AA5G156300 [Arabis alpina]
MGKSKSKSKGTSSSSKKKKKLKSSSRSVLPPSPGATMDDVVKAMVISSSVVEIPSSVPIPTVQKVQSSLSETELTKTSSDLDAHVSSDLTKVATVKVVSTAEAVQYTHQNTGVEQAQTASENPAIVPVVATEDSTVKPTTNDAEQSWANLVRGSAKPLKKTGQAFLLDSGEVCVKIPNPVIERNKKSGECFVLGQFYSDPPSQGTIHNIVNGIWSKQMRDIAVSKMEGNSFLFRIPNSFTRNRVINQRLWQIEGQTMFVAKWEPGVIPTKPELTSAPIWLELRNVPLQFFHEEGLERIASLVGDPKFLHPATANKTNLEVAKVFTIIDPRKPLPEAVNVQFDSGEIRRVGVSSPWMPPVCSHCREIGHSLKHCKRAPVTCKTCSATNHTTELCTKKVKPGPKVKKANRRRRSRTPVSNTGLVSGTQSGIDRSDVQWVVKTAASSALALSAVPFGESTIGNPQNQLSGESNKGGLAVVGIPTVTQKLEMKELTSEAEPDSEDETETLSESSYREEDAIISRLSKKQHKGQRGKSLKASL